MTSANARLVLDGKPVYAWLFARMIHVKGRQMPQMVQVEGFTLDHAWARLLARFPAIRRREWEMLSELEPEHDVGYLGEKLPLLPKAVLLDGSRRVQ